MPDTIACPYCTRPFSFAARDLGRLLACPACRNLFLLPVPRAPLAPAYRLPFPARPIRPTNPVDLIAVLGIAGSFACCLLAALAALAAFNAFVPHISRGVKYAIPAVPAPIPRFQMIASALVLAALGFIALADMIGLLLRREWARRLFFVASWAVCAIFVGELVGIIIMPDSSIEPWTLLLLLPLTLYCLLALRTLHRPHIRNTFS